MVATAITLSAVSCNTKSGSQPAAAAAAPDRTATTERIFAALPAKEVPKGITPQQRKQLLDSEDESINYF